MSERDGEKNDSKAVQRARRLLDDFLSGREQVTIYSDGDLDGMVASGLLLQYLDRAGHQEVELVFPSPGELRELRVSGAVLVELPPCKGLTYAGENLLLDHHGSGARVDLYREGAVVESSSMDGDILSVAGLVCSLLGPDLHLPKEAWPILRAVDRIDQGIYEESLDLQLHRAFRLHLCEPNLRPCIAEWVKQNRWENMKEWAEQASTQWDGVEEQVHELVESARLLPIQGTPTVIRVAYFTYLERDYLAAAALREAMLRLEKRYPIVVALCVRPIKGALTANRGHATPDEWEKEKEVEVVNASIATSSESIDLRPAFEVLSRVEGITAGGRPSIGGVQFRPNTTLNQALRLISFSLRIIWKKMYGGS